MRGLKHIMDPKGKIKVRDPSVIIKQREQDMDRVKIGSGFNAYRSRLGTRAHTKAGS